MFWGLPKLWKTRVADFGFERVSACLHSPPSASIHPSLDWLLAVFGDARRKQAKYAVVGDVLVQTWVCLRMEGGVAGLLHLLGLEM